MERVENYKDLFVRSFFLYCNYEEYTKKRCSVNIKGHLAYESYEKGIIQGALPYYRGIEMDCYWVTEDCYHNATYMFVIGTGNPNDDGE